MLITEWDNVNLKFVYVFFNKKVSVKSTRKRNQNQLFMEIGSIIAEHCDPLD